ncbi:MAG: deoxyribose-phosphate aldolase [Prevotellaceae bacterium]|nr:deoxyribose-phosphate aldolase [Prevotellaceae bacterium]
MNNDNHCNCHAHHHEHDHDHGTHHHEPMKSRYEQAFERFDLHLHDEIVQEEVKTLISRNLDENRNDEALRFLLGAIELTSLKVTDSEDSILQMVERVNRYVNDNPTLPHPAGICVYPRFVSVVSNSLEVEDMEVSTVCGGFPSAQTFPELKTVETALAVKDGATEIDTVMPVGYFLVGDYDTVYNEIDETKLACGQDTPLKVILETGALQTAVNVKKAAILAIYSGADYIKTSTGKVEPGATPAAVYTMCRTIKEYYEQTGTQIGIKVAGGVRTVEDALKYYTIVKEVLGDEWLDNRLFRIGASGLANAILGEIIGKKAEVF